MLEGIPSKADNKSRLGLFIYFILKLCKKNSLAVHSTRDEVSDNSVMRGIQALGSGSHLEKISCLLTLASDSGIVGSYEEGDVRTLNTAYKVCQELCTFILLSEDFIVGKFESFMAAKYELAKCILRIQECKHTGGGQQI